MAHDVDDARPLTVGEFRRTLDHRDRLTKNGETWRGYLRRLTSPTNVILVVGFIYMAGAEIRQVRVDLSNAMASNEASRAVEQSLAEDIEAIQAAIARLEALPAGSVEVDRQFATIRAQLQSIETQLKTKPDRIDVDRSVDELRVRLTRIEEQHRQFMRGRGAGTGS